ncbi:PAS domain-containing protein [Flavihumibacter sp. CACIAM 22H1]|uniref:PAS domain-containing protein n=1 Tax=Flavihumibacter sp. CACIAM 22H1 TaxID=1812911 RepID=UPI000AD593D2|nr:PAS domain-containing protein [Flavihumibacter sp. CACIAM 22H1]
MVDFLLNEIPYPAVVLRIADDEPVCITHSNKAFQETDQLGTTICASPALNHWVKKIKLHKNTAPVQSLQKDKLVIDGPFSSKLLLELSLLPGSGTAERQLLCTIPPVHQPTPGNSYSSLIAGTTDLCVILNKAGEYTYLSANFPAMLGYDAAELMGTNSLELVHPDDISATRQAFERLGSELSVQAPPFRYRKKDGSWCWLQSVGTNLLELPSVQGFVINSIDITQLVEAHQLLKQNNERYQLIYKASNDALYDWDIEADSFYWGEGFYRLFGHSAKTTPFRLANWIELTHYQDAEKNKQRWDEFLKDTQQNSWINKFRFRKADGSYAYVEEIAYLIRDKEGRPLRMIGSIRDKTESKLVLLRKLIEQDITDLFKSTDTLPAILQRVTDYLAQTGNWSLAELWLLNNRQDKIKLVAYHLNPQTEKAFYPGSQPVQEFSPGNGLPGTVWKNKQPTYWDQTSIQKNFIRKEAASKANLKAISGLPIFDNGQILGTLVLGKNTDLEEQQANLEILESILPSLGTEIRRKQQEEEMRLVFESAPDILAIVSPEGYFTRVNPTFCAIMGYSSQELTSRPYHMFIHPDDVMQTLKEFGEIIPLNKKAVNVVNRYITKTGEQRWISWSSSEIFGSEKLAFAYGRDITEMKELEDLIDNTSKLARVGSWEINMSDKYIFCSKITRQILELKDGLQLRLNNRLEYIRHSSRERVRKLLQEVLFDQKPWDIEVEIRTAKGASRWVRLIGQASFHQGRCVRIYGSIQDIHEKKLVQLQLEEANDRFERVSSATNDAIWDWDLIHNRLIWNDRFSKIFGYPVKAEGTGPNEWKDMVHPDDLPLLGKNIREATNDPEHHHIDIEFRFRRSDGSYAYVSNKGTLIRNKEGQVIRMVGALSDISVRKNFESSLKNLNQELKRINHELAGSNAELEQFAFVASHDLQEPLRMITGFLTMLEKKYGPQLDEKANQYIYFAVDGAKRMRGIILDLLEYSRVGRMNTTRELVDANLVIKDVVQLLQNQLEEKNVGLSVHPMPSLYTYKLPLQQVLQNLISNAIKYSQPGKQPLIEVSCQELDQYWEFSVKDNGIGIEAAFKEKVFVIFQRLNYTPEIPGSGMGLAIAKKIIDWQGGEIWVESVVGEGSIFYFRLPK